jgi:hemolysin activation/secretion protein
VRCNGPLKNAAFDLKNKYRDGDHCNVTVVADIDVSRQKGIWMDAQVQWEKQTAGYCPAGQPHRVRRLLVTAAVIAATWSSAAGVEADSVVGLLSTPRVATTHANSPQGKHLTAPPATRIAPATAAAQKPSAANSQPAIRAVVPARTAAIKHLIPATRADGPVYPVSEFILAYKYPRHILPAISKLMTVPLHLARSKGGYISAGQVVAGKPTVREQYPAVTLTLAEINAAHKPQHFYLSALESIEQQLVQRINTSGIIGVYVQVSGKDFRGRRDLRRSDDTTLHLTIHEAIVQQVRTIASGQGFGGKKTIDNGRTAFIRNDSPIKSTKLPATNAAADDVLEQHWLDDYVLRLNQQPGRQVSIALSPGSEPDSVILDYLVHEAKPWLVYAQISNTGTPQTSSLVEQFGFIDDQLTGHDDILNVNYDTASFDKAQDVNVSYQFPIFGIDRLQGRIFGGYQQYNASNVGLGNLNFNGRTAFGGGELILNIAQFRNLFLYGVLGAQYQQVHVDNVSFQQSASADFYLPYVSLRLNRTGNTSHQTGSVTVLGQYTDASQQSLNNLGRLNTNPTWAILQANAEDSFYLEPLLFHQDFAAGRSTLANQILLRMSGQYAFGQRLIPQEESVIGGLYSVRGYPQSIVAGDSGIYGTVQYNLHIPRLFPVNPNPKTNIFGHLFRMAPQTPYGRPDWDLVLSAFLDAGEVAQSQKQSYEAGATLIGTGVGAKVTISKNISALVDWAVALNPVSAAATGQGGVTAGSTEVNFVFSVSY